MPVTLRLYDTATREMRDFVPVTPGQVGIYHCGLTVQGPPHVGHIRKEVTFDVARRWFEHLGYQVTLVRAATAAHMAEEGIGNRRSPVRDRCTSGIRQAQAGSRSHRESK